MQNNWNISQKETNKTNESMLSESTSCGIINQEMPKSDTSPKGTTKNFPDENEINSLSTIENNNVNDPYSYINRCDFTSEVFKIEIKNLPPHLGYNQLKNFLKKLGLKPHKIKALKNPVQFAFVTFKCEEDRQQALAKLNHYVWKKREIIAKIASPMADPLVNKRKQEENENDLPPEKRPKTEECVLSTQELLSKAINPLCTIPYSEQLNSKMKNIRHFIIQLGRKITKENPKLEPWLSEQRKKNKDDLWCSLEDISASPLTEEYRNKCEFTTGPDRDSGARTVGFRLSSYRKGSMAVAEPSGCIIIPPQMKKLAKVFQEYIQQSSLDVYNPETYTGYWRGLTVRTTRGGELLAIIVFHPQTLSSEEIEAEKKKLQEFFDSGNGKECNVSSLWFQIFDKLRADNTSPNVTHLSGKKKIVEDLLGMKFHISPEAFFQINTLATEVLYTKVAEVLNLSPEITLLDICCGTGTIGLTLARNVNKVIGIELCPQAIEDAKFNAQVNGITNAQFVCGRAEDVIHQVLQEAEGKEIVAVLDPPRPGVNTKVVKAIRGCSAITKLVYVSCSPSSALENMVQLCRSTSKNYRGDPFIPVKAVPVDLFPHTNHCELVMLFERYKL